MLRHYGEYTLPAHHLPGHPLGPAVMVVDSDDGPAGLADTVGRLLMDKIERWGWAWGWLSLVCGVVLM